MSTLFLFSIIILLENDGEFTMIKIKLLTKIYAKKKEAIPTIKEEIEDHIKDLDVHVESFVIEESGFINVTLNGEDEIAASNFLISIYGQSLNFDKLKEGDILKGYITSSGKVGFGVFVDIGIKEPYAVDALIPQYTLRKQLAKDLKLPTRKIIEMYGLIDNLPIEITIDKVSIGMKKIEARFSEQQLLLFNTWIEEGLDRLYIIGAFDNEIKYALSKTNHTNDIIAIEKIGWMEYILTCKFNTSAKGLIPEIGRILQKTRFEIFSPGNIKKELKD
ncbi:MAG: DUF2110 family protein [Asgard group archaeon]|nr:DUF2110 family protein [Asgard group archaeon]